MTAATIKTTKAELLFVMLPDYAVMDSIQIRQNIFSSSQFSLVWIESEVSSGRFELPEGNWTLLGNAFQLNSEVMERVCDCETYKSKSGDYTPYFDYCSGKYLGDVLNSYTSLLKRLEIYAVNPFGEEPDHLDYKFEKYLNELHFISEGHKNRYADAHEKWQHAQSRTGNWICLASFINSKK